MITDFKEFFIKELITFINTDTGSFFGSYSFGSNVKKLIQSKETRFDISDKFRGFINDFAILYDQAFT